MTDDLAAFGVETIELDLPPLVGALSRRLHDAGLPITPGRSIGFARALALVRPVARRRLYWTARAVFVSDQAQVPAFDAVFFSIFGNGAKLEDVVPEDVRTAAAPPDERPRSEPAHGLDSETSARLSSPTLGHRDEDGRHAELERPVAMAG